jgi:hypothetical protein
MRKKQLGVLSIERFDYVLICIQCFHLQGFFLAARKYWSLQGICNLQGNGKEKKSKGNCKDFCNLYQLQV